MPLSPLESPGVQQQRLASLARHQTQVMRAQRIITPQIAQQAADLAQYNPSLDAGIVGGLSLMPGITPESPVMDLVSEREAYRQSEESLLRDRGGGGIFGEWVWNPMKGLIRNTFLGLEGLMQEAESAFVRTPVGMAQGLSLGEAYGEAGRSDAFHALNAALSGERVHAGTGFFATNQVDDDAYIQQQLREGQSLENIMAAQEYKRQYGVDIAQVGEQQRQRLQITHGGSGKSTPVSLGRLAAISVTEPGTRPFQIFSGVVDAGKQVFLDPADLALAGVGKWAKLRKLLYTPEQLANPTMATAAMRTLNGSLLGQTPRKAIFARTVDEWLDMERGGQGFMRWIQEQEGAEGTRALYEIFGRKQKRAVDPRMVRALADSTDLDEIRTILKNGYESGSLRNVMKAPGGTRGYMNEFVRHTTLGTYMGRMASVTNSRVLNIEDPADAVASFDTYLTNMGLSADAHADLLNRAIRIDTENIPKYAGVEGQQDLYSQYFGLVKEATGTWLDELGVQADAPLRLAAEKLFDNQDAYRSFWVDNVGQDVLFGGARVTYAVDGKVTAMPSAVMFSQFLNQAIPLIDSQKMRSLMRRTWIGESFARGGDESSVAASWLKKTFGEDDWEKVGNNAVVNALDWGMSNLWKPSVLLRMAWPVRVIGEEQLRLSGKLMAGAFNHPLQYIALMATKDKRFLGRIARMTDDVLGNSLIDDVAHESAMSSSSGSIAEALTGKKAGVTGHRYESAAVAQMTDQEFLQAYVFEMNQLVKDDVARQVAGRAYTHFLETGDFDITMLDELKETFWSGDMKFLRERMLRDSGRWDLLANRAFSDGYIDTVYGKIVHLGGGDGYLLDPYSKKWHNFNGEELGPAEIRELMGLDNTAGRKLDMEMAGAGPYEAMPVMREQLHASFGTTEGQARFSRLEEIFDGAMDDLGDPYEATDVVIDEFKLLMADSDSPNQAMEFIATWEAQRGIGALAEGRSRFNRMYQTLESGALGKETIDGQLETAMGAIMRGPDNPRGLMAYDLQGTPLRAPELDYIQGEVIQLGDSLSATGETVRTFVWADRGDLTAMLTVNVDDAGNIIGVPFVGGLNSTDLQKLADELFEDGAVSLQDIFSVNSGDMSFREWLINEGVEEALDSEEAFFKWLDENPDGLKRFYEIPEFGQTSPRMPGTDTTLHGSEFSRRATLAAKKESTDWQQHMPYFQQERPADPRVFQLVAEGKITDEAGNSVLDWGMRSGRNNPEIRKQFKGRMGYFGKEIDHWRNSSPAYLRRPVTESTAKDVSRMNTAVSVMMQTLMSKPTDYLSRSPAFRQFYWQRASELAAYLDDSDRVKFLEAAEKANILQAKDAKLAAGAPLRTIRRYSGRENTVDEAIRRVNVLADTPRLTEPGAISNLRQLDEVSKSYAVEQVRQLLYDTTKRHNFSETMRLAAPFGEAWYEVMSTWAKLMKENPRNIRRIQQVMQGARGSDPFRDTGPDGEQGRGFFFRDENGEEVFAFPGTNLIQDWMPFVGGYSEVKDQLELTGRVSGLNIMGQVMPGVGPLVQIPVSQLGFFDDVENPNRWLRDLVMPFGKSAFEITDPTTYLSPITPRWFSRALQAWGTGGDENQRLYANTVIDVYKTLLMQGYSADTPEEMSVTLDRAKSIAGDITRIRALSNWAAPTAAGERWEVRYDPQDVEGDVWTYQNLASAYRQILEQNGNDDVLAFKQFVDIFGLDPTLFRTSKTQRLYPRAVTLEARKWQQNNDDLFDQEQYPNTAYFANPDPADGEFDYETYLIQLEEDTRQPLSPEQWGLKRNQFLGRIGYANQQRIAERRFQDQAQRNAWLQAQHRGFMELYPGYGQPIVGLPAKPGLDAQIAELEAWKDEPRLGDSEVGQLLQQYLSMRDRIVRISLAQYGYTSDTGFRNGKRAVLLRRQLRALGNSLARQSQDFGQLWNQILSRELDEPEATMSPVNLAGVTF